MNRAERFQKVLEYFDTHDAPAETELRYNSSFELLVAVILSAQCTDKRVNLVTPALFRDYPTAAAMAQATPETLYEYIKSISYPNSKARHLAGMARMLMSDFGGRVPADVAELTRLPGVGRKTANVIASVVFSKPAMAVDTHVFRVSNRLGLTNNARTPLQCEKQLITFIPEHLVHKAHHWLILHGRYVCVARQPKCWECPLTRFCKYFEKNIELRKKTGIKNQIKQKPHGKEDTKKKIGQKSDKKRSEESF
jgi:endonuclease III